MRWQTIADGKAKDVISQEHLKQIVHSVFLEKFEAAETCGPESAYDAIAHEIWTRFLADQQGWPS